MCFVVPLRVIEINANKLLMEDGREVKSVLTEEVKVGDYLVCQLDLAIEKISKKQALVRRKIIKGVSDEISRS